MENKAIFKFNHSVSKISDALGITKNLDSKCSEIIFFSAISNHFIASELFDDKADAPPALTTMTGDLEKAISLCKTEEEVHYVLLMFRQFHEISMDSIAKYTLRSELDGSKRKHLDLMMQMMELKIEEKAEDMCSECITPSEMFKRIENVKKSRYDFDKYFQLSNGANNIDDILKNVFKDNDESKN